MFRISTRERNPIKKSHLGYGTAHQVIVVTVYLLTVK